MTTAAALLALALAAAAAAAVLQTARATRLERRAAGAAERAAEAGERAAEAEERAAAAVEARDGFFDLATHELRSPLAAILGYQELLQDGAYGVLPEAAADPVTRIGRSARHLLHLIDGLVELSRLRAGALRADLQAVHTGPLVAGIADAFRAHARDRKLEPVVDIQDDLPTIVSDPDRLLRALDLLVTSAVKHPAQAALHLDIASDGHDLRVRIHPTDLAVHDYADDPELRLGIRIAVAARVAELLGGGLDLETDHRDDVIRAVAFRVSSLEGAG